MNSRGTTSPTTALKTKLESDSGRGRCNNIHSCRPDELILKKKRERKHSERSAEGPDSHPGQNNKENKRGGQKTERWGKANAAEARFQD